MALARASRIQDKLNSNELKSDGPIWKHATPVLNCFRRALEIDSSNLSLWIEYGTMSYALHSFASRQLKQWKGELPSELVQQVRWGTVEGLPPSCLTGVPFGRQTSVLSVLCSCLHNHAGSLQMIFPMRLKPYLGQ
ncbi:Calcineurin-binding protein cabin-1 [Pteropus alecto]|uniref:Calcineurin-binding protein cabin-1 n=1 Tax=Pteropus alecto TaxID=9402 RepID=L5KX78_PTEAL|nr:Calcineurin-binding protein cabin-1 [Pteropus alecto]